MTKILSPIENLLGFLLAQIYSVIPSLGIAIIIVTMLVMLLIFPLTHKQTKSMLAMQALQPKVKALQEKYKDDRQTLSQETMALYKEAGVNPLGGCLPLLIQMPFLISIFRVVREIEKFVSPTSKIFGVAPSQKLFQTLCAPTKTVEMCRANAGALLNAGAAITPEGAEALATKLPVGKQFFGLNLSKSMVGVTNASALTIAAYIGLIVLLAAASYISISRQQALNPNTPSQMKFLKYLFPLGVSVSGVLLPAGSNLYILTSSIWRACQQELLYRKVIRPHREKTSASEVPPPPQDQTYVPGKARQKRKKK